MEVEVPRIPGVATVGGPRSIGELEIATESHHVGIADSVRLVQRCAGALQRRPVDHEMAEIAIALGEALATCDMPAGVVNILTTDVQPLLKVVIRHDDVDALYLSTKVVDADLLKEIHIENATVMRRLLSTDDASKAATPIEMSKLAEVQTVWMSSLEMKGGAAAY